MHEGMPLPAPLPCLWTWATHLDHDLPPLPTYAWFSWLLSTQSVTVLAHLLIPVLNQHLQRAFSVPGTLLGARTASVNKTDKIPRPPGAYGLLGEENNTQAKEAKCIAY